MVHTNCRAIFLMRAIHAMSKLARICVFGIVVGSQDTSIWVSAMIRSKVIDIAVGRNCIFGKHPESNKAHSGAKYYEKFLLQRIICLILIIAAATSADFLKLSFFCNSFLLGRVLCTPM